jgi:hypothetical protein
LLTACMFSFPTRQPSTFLWDSSQRTRIYFALQLIVELSVSDVLTNTNFFNLMSDRQLYRSLYSLSSDSKSSVLRKSDSLTPPCHALSPKHPPSTHVAPPQALRVPSRWTCSRLSPSPGIPFSPLNHQTNRHTIRYLVCPLSFPPPPPLLNLHDRLTKTPKCWTKTRWTGHRPNLYHPHNCH